MHFSCDTIDDLSAIAYIFYPCINHVENEQLFAPISDEEIWLAIKSIGALKAPSLDGLSAGFYHEC